MSTGLFPGLNSGTNNPSLFGGSGSSVLPASSSGGGSGIAGMASGLLGLVNPVAGIASMFLGGGGSMLGGGGMESSSATSGLNFTAGNMGDNQNSNILLYILGGVAVLYFLLKMPKRKSKRSKK